MNEHAQSRKEERQKLKPRIGNSIFAFCKNSAALELQTRVGIPNFFFSARFLRALPQSTKVLNSEPKIKSREEERPLDQLVHVLSSLGVAKLISLIVNKVNAY